MCTFLLRFIHFTCVRIAKVSIVVIMLNEWKLKQWRKFTSHFPCISAVCQSNAAEHRKVAISKMSCFKKANHDTLHRDTSTISMLEQWTRLQNQFTNLVTYLMQTNIVFLNCSLTSALGTYLYFTRTIPHMCGRMWALEVMFVHMKSLWLSDKHRQTIHRFVWWKYQIALPSCLSLKGQRDWIFFP